MKTFVAFFKKECTAQLRTGKLLFVALIFVAVGLLNPVTAKLTPWLLEMMQETLASSGMNIAVAPATALDSWLQFYKNMPLALIGWVLFNSSIFTKEYRSGTLILSLTKGLERYKVAASKALMLVLVWTAAYWVCFGITYGVNTVWWDNAVAVNLGFAAFCCWLYGVWIAALICLGSVIFKSNIGVLAFTGGVEMGLSFLTLIPEASKYMPAMLGDGTSLVYGLAQTGDYIPSVIITAVLSVICIGVSVPLFNKKQL